MKSLAVKLWLGMILLVAVTLLLVWLFQIVFLEKYYQQARIDEVVKKTVSITEEMDKTNFIELNEGLEKISVNYNAMIDIFDAKGNINPVGEFASMPMFRNVALNMLPDILKGDIKTERTVHPRFNSEYALIGIPVKANSNLLVGIIVYLPLNPVRETAALLKKQLIYVSVLVLLSSIAISYYLSRMFANPILKINAAAEKMASGDLAVKLDIRSEDEIGRLAATMNFLAFELSKIDQLRKDLIANISHELRTPLSLIKGYAETIRDVTGEAKEKRLKQLGIIIDESERLGKIVDDILNLSQMQSGYFALNMEGFRIDRTLDRVMSRYELIAEKLRIKMDFVNPGHLMVLGDENRIEQVLYNLMNNALNHTPEEGLITVKALEKEGFVKVEISDTGSGISQEDLKHIWDRYYKVEKSGVKRHIGTGLGLAIVKSILESHNSIFGVISKEGQGTTFWFELPEVKD